MPDARAVHMAEMEGLTLGHAAVFEGVADDARRSREIAASRARNAEIEREHFQRLRDAEIARKVEALRKGEPLVAPKPEQRGVTYPQAVEAYYNPGVGASVMNFPDHVLPSRVRLAGYYASHATGAVGTAAFW